MSHEMKVYKGLDHVFQIKKPIITAGTFDGVHVGHRKIIQRIIQLAGQINGESVVVTFDPHPRIVLFPDDHQVQMITTLDEKLELLEKAGVQNVVMIPFTRDFSRITSFEFVKEILVGKLHVHQLVIGYDHQFGRNREGSIEQLIQLAPQFDFEIEEIPPQDIDDIKVSSTKIRNAILTGDIQTANMYLTRPFSFFGTVVKGQQIGRTLGYPTANIQLVEQLKILPGMGIYAVKVIIDHTVLNGMMNIGKRPTFENDGDINIEVHIFDLSHDLYGKKITIEVVDRIRDEQKFNDAESLRLQIQQDELAAKRILNLSA
jgi:riboflavin kinase/FMN adenylyltransferase